MNLPHLNEAHLDEAILNEYVDGLLYAPESAGALAQVEAHLAVCEMCRNRLAELQWLFVALDNLPEEEPSRDFALSTIAILNARATPVRTPALGFVTIQLLVTIVVAALLWPLLSPLLARVAGSWSQPLQLQLAAWQVGMSGPLLRGFEIQEMQTLGMQTLTHWGQQLGQQLGEPWGQTPALSLPEFSTALWLSLLGAICLLWVATTRWLVFMPTGDHAQQPNQNTPIQKEDQAR